MSRHASKLVGLFLEGLKASGRSDAPIRRRFSLGPSSRAKGVDVTVAQEREILDATAREARDPFFGLHLAARSTKGSWGVIEYVASSAPSVGEGLSWLLTQSPLVSEVADVSLNQERGRGVLEHRVRGAPAGLGAQGNEFVLALIVRVGRDATSVHLTPTRVWFSHRRSGDIGELARFFGTRRLAFGQSANGLSVPLKMLGLKMRTADPALHEILAAGARSRAELRADGSIRRVRAALREALQSRRPDIEFVAGVLRVGPRTLQRQLEKEDARFQVLLDEERASLSRAYLEDAALPLGEIAYRLGYDRVSSFVRAFHRWTGSTPAAWRQDGTRGESRAALPGRRPRSRFPSG